MSPVQTELADVKPGFLLQRSSRRRIQLATGELEVAVTRADLALEYLCDFAARRNQKRGFLFVSKVLGRHLPASPSTMRDIHRRLAAKIPADLPGPVVILGLAETAICLGQGVHAQYLDRTRRSDVLFIHTTRHLIDHPLACLFFEEHSHAAQHFLYLPKRGNDRVMLAAARSVVLVDDEVSTGRTLVNLTRALSGVDTSLERVLCLTITDWRGSRQAEEVAGAMPVPASWMSLLEGEYRFSPRPIGSNGTPAPCGRVPVQESRGRRNDGRLGLRRPPRLPGGVASGLGLSPGERILVLGTGEFCYLPFRLAETLEADGHEVYCQATTSSPALLGHAIRRLETSPDCGGSALPSFLYNVEPGVYDHIFLCSERAAGAPSRRLLDRLNATPLVL
jgi:hypothetical protein